MDISFHYPPELFSLLVEAIPKLCKSKKDLLLFFQGAGISQDALAAHADLLRTNRDAFKKHVVCRELLTDLNAKGEKNLGQRRELLKRVTQFDDFSVCWETDRAAARGLVAQIRELVNVKDSFTRMNQEREKERQQRKEISKREVEEKRKKSEKLLAIQQQFFSLFAETNPYKRGKAIEAVLSEYFAFSGILVSEPITVKGDPGAGIVEQIDGVIQLRGQLYLVEVKWEQETLGREKTAPHLVRVFSRGLAGGVIISYSDYSTAAINDCREALRDKIVVLCKLDEFVRAIEREANLNTLLGAKVDAAVIHKNPLLLS